MARPQRTRLRWVAAKDPEDIEIFINSLSFRVMLYDIAHDGKRWICWFVPEDDIKIDVASVDLDKN